MADNGLLIIRADPQQAAAAGAAAVKNANNLKPLMNRISARMLSAVRLNFQLGGRPQRWPVSRRAMESGGKTLIDRALLLNSVQRSHNENSAFVFSRDKRAAIHEFGGTIVPRKAKALTIPISPLARGKTARYFSRTETFLLKREGKRALIMLKRDGKVLPLYVLLDSVQIPARPFIRPPQRDIDEWERMIGEWVTRK